MTLAPSPSCRCGAWCVTLRRHLEVATQLDLMDHVHRTFGRYSRVGRVVVRWARTQGAMNVDLVSLLDDVVPDERSPEPQLRELRDPDRGERKRALAAYLEERLVLGERLLAELEDADWRMARVDLEEHLRHTRTLLATVRLST